MSGPTEPMKFQTAATDSTFHPCCRAVMIEGILGAKHLAWSLPRGPASFRELTGSRAHSRPS